MDVTQTTYVAAAMSEDEIDVVDDIDVFVIPLDFTFYVGGQYNNQSAISGHLPDCNFPESYQTTVFDPRVRCDKDSRDIRNAHRHSRPGDFEAPSSDG